MMKPRRELSEIVTVNSGPGISAPDSAMTKEETKIVMRTVKVYFLIFSYSLPRYTSTDGVRVGPVFNTVVSKSEIVRDDNNMAKAHRQKSLYQSACLFRFGSRLFFDQLSKTLWWFNKIMTGHKSHCIHGTVVNANTATNAAFRRNFGSIIYDCNRVHLASIHTFSAAGTGINIGGSLEIAGNASDGIVEAIDPLQDSTTAGATIAYEVNSFSRVAGCVNQAGFRTLL
jgi:hypothetical protein